MSGEGDKMEVLFPLIRKNGWDVIALTCDNSGIAADAAKIMVGGVPVTERFAAYIKADAYSEDASEAVKAARKLMGQLQM